jgi:hypothetical protein
MSRTETEGTLVKLMGWMMIHAGDDAGYLKALLYYGSRHAPEDADDDVCGKWETSSFFVVLRRGTERTHPTCVAADPGLKRNLESRISSDQQRNDDQTMLIANLRIDNRLYFLLDYR